MNLIVANITELGPMSVSDAIVTLNNNIVELNQWNINQFEVLYLWLFILTLVFTIYLIWK